MAREHVARATPRETPRHPKSLTSGKRALRPPRVVFVIGCVSCNTFSHFRQNKLTTQHTLAPVLPSLGLCLGVHGYRSRRIVVGFTLDLPSLGLVGTCISVLIKRLPFKKTYSSKDCILWVAQPLYG
jgi:hypothetical protein